MRLEVTTALAGIPRESWNSLHGSEHPFLSHEFLSALEAHGCVIPARGWKPWHLPLYDGERLVAAAPAYLKGHSWGEFVFDWSWAGAHDSAGLDYYPKLICAVPFSPVTGPRVLSASKVGPEALDALAAGAIELARSHELSSVHWLFPEPAQAARLAGDGYGLRHGCQFHWENRGYSDFADFLAALSSKKRKNLRQERAAVARAGVEFEWLHGADIDADTWRFFFEVYSDTFHRHGNRPPLPLAFFREIGESLGDRVLLVVGRRGGERLCAALCLRSEDTLYGRYWGSLEELPGLHFEACYYQGIEYCIRHGLARFEPGAQGEHKVARGFLPTLTYSAHWIRDPGLAVAIADFLRRETPHVEAYAAELARHSPFKAEPER